MATRFRSIRRCRSLRLVQALAIGVVPVMAAGCSEQGSAEQMENMPVTVETSQMFATIRNNAGLPLTDVPMAILPIGRQTEFTKFFGRPENSEKRDISLGTFSGRDGTPFSLRVIKPKSIRIKATDLNGKAYDFEIPWK